MKWKIRRRMRRVKKLMDLLSPMEIRRIRKKRNKLKELNRMLVSELKQYVKRPDVVEAWNVTSKDLLFYEWLKCSIFQCQFLSTGHKRESSCSISRDLMKLLLNYQIMLKTLEYQKLESLRKMEIRVSKR
jgi:hypothetical protein